MRILIADPDRELVTTLQGLLKHEGHEASAAFDGVEALRICTESMPDVLITEGLLPKIGGFDLAKQIRQLPNGGMVSILLMSSIFVAAKFQRQLKEAQIDDVLGKPFMPDDLIEKIEQFEVTIKSRPLAIVAQNPDRVANSGSLSETPFIRLAYQLYRHKDTGVLRLQNETTKKLVTFENGEPKFVVSNLETECLGQLLVKKGRLTSEELKNSLAMMGELKKRQGETLIQLGLIEPYELDEELKYQAREKFCEIFEWRDGQYLFVPGSVVKKDLTAVDLSLPQLCLRGVKEHYTLAAVQTELLRFTASRPVLNKNAIFTFEDFKFATWDTRIVRQIQQSKTIDQILAMHVARDIDVYQLFVALYLLDVIAFETPKSVKPRAEKPEPVLPKSPFDLLGVLPNASNEAIQKAYNEMLSRVTDPLEQVEILKALKSAFDQVATQQGRKDYLLRAYSEEGTVIENARDIFQPTEILELGKGFLETKDIARAKKVFQDGLTWFPDDGLFFSYYGLCLFREASSDKEPSLENKERSFKAMIIGMQKSPENEETHFILGRAFALDQQYENAVSELSKVIKLKPKHREAAAELRLAQKRMEKQAQTSFVKWKR